MLKKQFKFKVSEESFSEMLDDCYREVIYTATESEVNNDEYIVSWIDPETNELDSIEYHKEAVESFVDNGSWLIIEKGNSGGDLNA